MDEPTCAVWYWRHGSVMVEMCDSEQEAVRFTLGVDDDGSGSPAGVQFTDGRYIARAEWTALLEEEERQTERMVTRWREERDRPKPATQEITPPFDAGGCTATVVGEVPAWLGDKIAENMRRRDTVRSSR